VCAPCEKGYTCVLVVKNCNACASTACQPVGSLPVKSDDGVIEQKSETNVGAIAGGSIGGIAVIGLVAFLVWRYYFRARKEEEIDDVQDWQTVEVTTEKGDSDFTQRRDARASTHTVASYASSVLTRASNIIQIAYIPGVTNRNAGSPGVLVPPVPPIPIATSPSATTACSPFSTEDQHFFLPGNLRDSTYSGLSDGRSSFARTSITPSLARSSVATTIYRNNAIVSPLPAQTIVRGKAAVVSVKSSQANSPVLPSGGDTPPVPAIDFEKHKAPVRIQMPRSTDGSLQPSPQGSVKGVYAKPVPLNISRGKITASSSTSSKQSSVRSSPLVKPRPLTEVSIADSEVTDHARAHRLDARSIYTDSIVSDSDSDDGDDHARSRRSLLGASPLRDSQVTDIQDTPGMLQSPFLDSSDASSPELAPRFPKKQSSNLTPVVEESSKRVSKDRNGSPFSDAHAVPGN
jgi:hypothetical protein